MDWILNNWDQIGAYNLGTAVTGLVVVCLCIRAFLGTESGLARAVAVSFAGLGLYMLYRGGWWFLANQTAPEGSLYNPFFVANRWTIWLFIVPMEMALIWLYMKLFRHHGWRGLLLVSCVIAGYGVGGLL